MMPDPRTNSHVLLTLGVLFTLGGATRFLPGHASAAETKAPVDDVASIPILPDKAVAKSSIATRINDAAESAEDATIADEETRPAAILQGEVCFTGKAAEDLSQDRWLFEKEVAELRQEQLDLKAWQAELKAQTAELAALQQAIDGRWQQMQVVAGEDISHLADMYASMKPDQAAKIFDQMDPSFAAGFLRQLSSDQSGLILAGMETGKAYAVSVKMAALNNDIRQVAAN